MKKTLLILLVVLVSIVVLSAILYITNNTINLQTSQLDLINEVVVDLSSCKNLNINQGNSFTCFFQENTNVEDIRKHYLEEYNLEFPEFDFDFDKYYLAISFNRKIVDIKYYRHSFNQKDTGRRAHIIFDSIYSDGRVYMYQMDKVLLEDVFIDGNYFYIMNGSKRVFKGRSIFDINE